MQKHYVCSQYLIGKKMKQNKLNIFMILLAVLVAISLTFTSVVRANDDNNDNDENGNNYAQWYISQSDWNRVRGGWNIQGSGPDWGFAPTYWSQSQYSPMWGSQNYSTGGMTYSGGLPIYAGSSTPWGNRSYSPFSSFSGANTTAGWGMGGGFPAIMDATGPGYGYSGYGYHPGSSGGFAPWGGYGSGFSSNFSPWGGGGYRPGFSPGYGRYFY